MDGDASADLPAAGPGSLAAEADWLEQALPADATAAAPATTWRPGVWPVIPEADRAEQVTAAHKEPLDED